MQLGIRADPAEVQVYLEVEPEYVMLGTDVRFQCIVEGDENASIAWSRSEAPLPVRAKVSYLENLRIPPFLMFQM